MLSGSPADARLYVKFSVSSLYQTVQEAEFLSDKAECELRNFCSQL